jgi:hypothetical protein
MAMNHYVRQLEMKHAPDIIIVGVPGAALLFDSRFSTDFGIIAYEISEAVKSDFAILSSPCAPYDKEFFRGIEDGLQGRLGVSVDAHSLSPYALDFAAEMQSLSYLSLSDTFVCDIIEQIGYDKLYNLNNIDGISSVVDLLIDKLSNDDSSLLV